MESFPTSLYKREEKSPFDKGGFRGIKILKRKFQEFSKPL